jgi:hypothetical protein
MKHLLVTTVLLFCMSFPAVALGEIDLRSATAEEERGIREMLDKACAYLWTRPKTKAAVAKDWGRASPDPNDDDDPLMDYVFYGRVRFPGPEPLFRHGFAKTHGALMEERRPPGPEPKQDPENPLFDLLLATSEDYKLELAGLARILAPAPPLRSRDRSDLHVYYLLELSKPRRVCSVYVNMAWVEGMALGDSFSVEATGVGLPPAYYQPLATPMPAMARGSTGLVQPLIQACQIVYEQPATQADVVARFGGWITEIRKDQWEILETRFTLPDRRLAHASVFEDFLAKHRHGQTLRAATTLAFDRPVWEVKFNLHLDPLQPTLAEMIAALTPQPVRPIPEYPGAYAASVQLPGTKSYCHARLLVDRDTGGGEKSAVDDIEVMAAAGPEDIRP